MDISTVQSVSGVTKLINKINDALRKYHQDKIRIGMKGNGHEGGTVVAKYVVSKIVGIFSSSQR
mgnify:CR=1 FL=1